MQRFLQIVLVVFISALFEIERVSIAPAVCVNDSYEICDLHHEQLICNNRHNIDIERTSTISAPSARTTSVNTQRQIQQRNIVAVVFGSLPITDNYPVSPFIHRIGTSARAIDFYLYMLCQLRL